MVYSLRMCFGQAGDRVSTSRPMMSSKVVSSVLLVKNALLSDQGSYQCSANAVENRGSTKQVSIVVHGIQLSLKLTNQYKLYSHLSRSLRRCMDFTGSWIKSNTLVHDSNAILPVRGGDIPWTWSSLDIVINYSWTNFDAANALWYNWYSRKFRVKL